VETVDDIIEELKPQVKHLLGDVQEAQQLRLFELEESGPETLVKPVGLNETNPPVSAAAKKPEKLESTKRVSPAVASLGPEELALYELIGDEATGADELIHKSALPPGRVLALLSLMEMRRVVKRLPGPSFSRY
jgi:DNA processing protein